MNITGEVEMTEAAYERAMLAARGLGGRTAPTVPPDAVPIIAGFGVIALILGLVLLLVNGQHPLGRCEALYILFIGVVFTYLPFRRERSPRVRVKDSGPGLVGPWRYELTDGRLKLTTPVASSELSWPGLALDHDDPAFWLVASRVSGLGMIIMKEAFSAEDRRTIADRLESLGDGRRG